MSSIRAIQMEKGLSGQLKKLNQSKTPVNSIARWSGVIESGPHAGLSASVLDLTSGVWATGNLRVILVAVPGEQILPATMVTMSHSFGTKIEGSFSMRAYCESPVSFTSAQAKFVRTLTQTILGQNGQPCEFFFGSATVQPQVEGVQGANAGAEAAASFISAGFDFPYVGSSYTGGV